MGTPGRIRQMVDEGHLKTDSIRMFCLDEADKMMERAFKNDVTFVFNKLPPAKQVMALSATYTSELASILTGGVTNSIFFRLLYCFINAASRNGICPLHSAYFPAE